MDEIAPEQSEGVVTKSEWHNVCHRKDDNNPTKQYLVSRYLAQLAQVLIKKQVEVETLKTRNTIGVLSRVMGRRLSANLQKIQIIAAGIVSTYGALVRSRALPYGRVCHQLERVMESRPGFSNHVNIQNCFTGLCLKIREICN